MKSKKKHVSINRKTIFSIIVFALLINAFMCISGSYIFDKTVQRIYNERGYVVAEIILDELDHDKIAKYANIWQEDDYYDQMSEYLENIKKSSNAAYIYIGVPFEDKTIKYIYDSGSEMGYVDPIAAPFDEIWDAYKTGKKPTSYLVRHSKYGYLTSSCLPIIDSTGNVVALLFVDTNMEVIDSNLKNFAVSMSIMAIVLLGVVCWLHWRYVHKNLIGPLLVMRKNVRDFASTTSCAENELKSIKTKDEVEDLAKSINNMEHEIVDYIEDIKSMTAEKERISTELNVATKIQADMLPRLEPPYTNRKEFDICATMTPAKEVGGDFYDFFFIDEDHIALVMADVSGKGVPAALFMAISKALIKNRALTGKDYSPANILTDVNNQLCEGNDADLFVTVWLAIIQLSTGHGIAANAGHEHPAIKRKDGEYELSIYKHSPVLGTIEGIRYKEHEFKLEPGDSIFVYTDGVPEATNIKEEFFGPERMLQALNKEPDAKVEKILHNVKQEIHNFVGDATQFDDITMLGFCYR